MSLSNYPNSLKDESGIFMEINNEGNGEKVVKGQVVTSRYLLLLLIAVKLFV